MQTDLKEMKLGPLNLLLVGACLPLAIVDSQLTTIECTNLAQSANCSFYTECVERNMSCGPSGYALGYGYPFCEAIEELSSQFTPEVHACSRLQHHAQRHNSTGTVITMSITSACVTQDKHERSIHDNVDSWPAVSLQSL